MKTFVISMRSAVDRCKFMQEQLSALGMDFEIFPAVDGRRLSQEELTTCCDFKWMRRYCGRVLTPGEIGCALSHIGIYRKIVDEQLPYALILEDDAWLTPSLIPLLELMEQKRIFDEGGIFVVQDTACGHWNKKNGKCIPLSDMYRFNEMTCACWTHAYIITLEAAKQLLRYLYPVMHTADCWGWIVHHHIARVFGLNFTMTTQNSYSLESTIGMERFEKRRTLKERITRPFWRLFWMAFDTFIPPQWYLNK